MSAGESERRYGPTSGTLTGIVGLGLCALVIGLVVAGDPTAGSVRVAIGAAGAAVLVWAYLLRPRIILEAGGATLVLRNPLSAWRIPLDTVRVVGVKTVTTVKTDDARYDAVAVGYPLRKLVREARPGMPGPSRTPMVMPSLRGTPLDPADDGPRISRQEEQTVMTEAILAAADAARLLRISGPPVSRTYAVVEIALLAVAVLAFAATYVV